VHSALKLRHQITPDRLATIAVGFVMAFIASILVVRPFLNIVRRQGFAPFAWYRIIVGIALLAAVRWGYL
jgi:undecaprenyl-diphosphatase